MSITNNKGCFNKSSNKSSLIIILLLAILFLPVIILNADYDSPYTITLELYSEDKESRLKAVDELGKRHLIWAKEKLIQVLLTDKDEDMRLKACEILSNKVESLAVEAFTYRIDDENIFVRLCAVKALRQFLDPYPIDALIDRLRIEDNDIYGVNKDYYDINLTSHYNVRKEIIKSLYKITKLRKKPRLRRRIIDVFKSHYEAEEDWGVRIEILESIIGLNLDAGVEALKKSLREETELYVINYAESKLRKMSRGAIADKLLAERNMLNYKISFKDFSELTEEEVIEYIRKNEKDYKSTALYHKDYRKRLDAVKKLGLIANGEIVDIIEKVLLEDENRYVRNSAAVILGECGDEYSAGVLIKAYYEDKNRQFRNEIIKSLSQLGVERSEY